MLSHARVLAIGTLLLAVGASTQAATITTYQMMLQSRVDTAAPNEVYVASYSSYGDLTQGTLGPGSGYTQIGISSAFQIAGLTWDGSAYRMMLQSRADTVAPNEVYVASYSTYDDLTKGILGPGSGYTQIGISSAFEIAGLTWDGSAYRMMLQSRADTAAPNEVYVASYATYDDLTQGTLGPGSGYTQIGISSSFRIVGLSSVTSETSPPPTVPEPGTFALLGLGLAGLVLSSRRTTS